MAFAMNSAPTGWLVCNGQAVKRAGVSGYPALFEAIDTTYGAGDNSTTFNLPDLRGYFVRGFGTAAGSGAFGAKQEDDFKAHTHPVNNIVLVGGYQGSGGGLVGRGSANSDSTGGTETRPKNIAMLYCIKF
jgi:microcystin-dependent protein